MTIQLVGIHVFVLVLARFTAMVLLNPLLSRRNVPVMARMGLVLALTLLVSANMRATAYVPTNDFDLMIAVLRELIIGMALGYVFQLFYYLIFFMGDLLDVEFGMSMSKVFDPSANVQMSLTGNYLLVFFILYFCSVGGLQQMIFLFASSFDAIELGGAVFTHELLGFGLELFQSVFVLTFRMVLPFMAAEFSMQLALGILMKLIPQIHVFVINFQLKQGLGLILLLLFAPAISGFMDRYVVLLFENMQRTVLLLAGTAS